MATLDNVFAIKGDRMEIATIVAVNSIPTNRFPSESFYVHGQRFGYLIPLPDRLRNRLGTGQKLILTFQRGEDAPSQIYDESGELLARFRPETIDVRKYGD